MDSQFRQKGYWNSPLTREAFHDDFMVSKQRRRAGGRARRGFGHLLLLRSAASPTAFIRDNSFLSGPSVIFAATFCTILLSLQINNLGLRKAIEDHCKVRNRPLARPGSGAAAGRPAAGGGGGGSAAAAPVQHRQAPPPPPRRR